MYMYLRVPGAPTKYVQNPFCAAGWKTCTCLMSSSGVCLSLPGIPLVEARVRGEKRNNSIAIKQALSGQPGCAGKYIVPYKERRHVEPSTKLYVSDNRIGYGTINATRDGPATIAPENSEDNVEQPEEDSKRFPYEPPRQVYWGIPWPISDTLAEYSPYAYFEPTDIRARHFANRPPATSVKFPKGPKTLTSLIIGGAGAPAEWHGTSPKIHEKRRALRPSIHDQHHQDSLFGNSFQSKSFFVVHPEWLSEAVDDTDPQPLHRPPWPWEQPRYRQNIQTPITYKVQEHELLPGTPMTNILEPELTPPGVPCYRTQPIGYKFTHPSIDDTKPFDKRTQFGAPTVDTSPYKHYN